MLSFITKRGLTSTLWGPLTKRNIATVVHQGYEAYRTTWGGNPVKLNPGWHWAIPIIHRVKKIDLRESSIDISNISALTKDNVPVKLNVKLFYQVYDAYNACFNVNDYISSLDDAGESNIKNIISNHEQHQIIPNQNKINELLTETVGILSAQWGTKLIRAETRLLSARDAKIELIATIIGMSIFLITFIGLFIGSFFISMIILDVIKEYFQNM